MDLVVRAEIHEEGVVAGPSEQDPQVVVHGEGSVGIQVPRELVRPKKRVTRIRHEAPMSCTQQ